MFIRREILRQGRHSRVRKNVAGSIERPRLNIYRSLNNIYAQVIDDDQGKTLVSASTLDKEIKGGAKSGGNKEAAKAVGSLLAKRAQEAGVKQVVFDRGGYQYHGRVQAVAEAAREGGLEF
ncbi:MAG TPA: 50S ribosomal protein L18 [Armatimonadota bacterium]|jgi:large subunit ribosomal protein L18